MKLEKLPNLFNPLRPSPAHIGGKVWGSYNLCLYLYNRGELSENKNSIGRQNDNISFDQKKRLFVINLDRQ